MATDQKQTITWQWESTPYGVGMPEENGLTLNLRMPGQYYDRESSLFYNWNRYYDPSTGEYVRPDPLGVKDTLQPFSYAANSPINNYDENGLRYIQTVRSTYPQAIIRYRVDVAELASKMAKLFDHSSSLLCVAKYEYDTRDVQEDIENEAAQVPYCIRFYIKVSYYVSDKGCRYSPSWSFSFYEPSPDMVALWPSGRKRNGSYIRTINGIQK